MSDHDFLFEQAAVLSSLTRALAHCCTAKEHELFQQFGLTSAEGHLVMVVAEREPVLPSVVADCLGVVRSRITPITQNLFEKGYLVRHEGEVDRRTRKLTLTTAGRKVADEAMRLHLQFHSSLLAEFADADREILMSTLHSLHQKMVEMRRRVQDSQEQNGE